MSVLALFTLGGLAWADCKPQYERFGGRAVGGFVASSAAGALSSAAAYPTLAFGILGGAVLKSDAIVLASFMLTGAELLAGGALSGTGTVLLVRRHSYNKVLHLIEDAELGGGPTLSAYAADLSAEQAQSIAPNDVVLAVASLNAEDAFCGPDGLLGFEEADAQVRLRLLSPKTDSVLGTLPPGQAPELR